MTVGDFHKALRKISTVGMMALDEVLRGGDRSERSTLGETLPDGSWGPVDTFEAKESKEALVAAVDGMPERERTVLMMYYYDGLTLTEIGQVLGVTESRVCQIHTKALRQLRSKLADRPETVASTRADPCAGPPGRAPASAPAAHACSCSPAEPHAADVRRAAARAARRAVAVGAQARPVARRSDDRYGTASDHDRAQGARHAFAQAGDPSGSN